MGLKSLKKSEVIEHSTSPYEYLSDKGLGSKAVSLNTVLILILLTYTSATPELTILM